SGGRMANVMTATQRTDPLTFELIKYGLSVLCDEMALTMARAAYSLIVRESLDFTTALLTPDGEVMAQGQTNALHLGSIMAALEGIRTKFGHDMQPGDVFINNDPYEGGSHLPDVFILKPLFVHGVLVAIAVGERGFMRLVSTYGYPTLRGFIDDIMDYTERMTRLEIAGWPRGEYVFSDAIDDDGLDPGPIPIKLTVRVQGDELEMDFSGTAPQVRGAITTPARVATAACYLAVRAAMPTRLPHNS